MTRVFNFSAGPSMLPEEVLQQAKEEILDWHHSGMSVMEMSHRGKYFSAIAERLEADLRSLLSIPDHYKILFMQGGATAQFSMVPLNLLQGKQHACYVNTGAWSNKAVSEAKKYCQVTLAANTEESGYTSIPPVASWNIESNAAYLHYTPNETIHGVEFQDVPDANGLPLVADMSSNILSREIDINRFGLIYAGTQKNMGPAGVTIVIIREDLINEVENTVPTVFDYAQQVKNNSLLNTPPTFNWYLVGLVLQWIQKQGGVGAIEKLNINKSKKLYQAIDQSSFYTNPVQKDCRSRMNVPFILADSNLDKEFLLKASENNLVELKGHRSVGGMRASIYNAMPETGVDALIQFMAEFERTH